MAITLKQCIHGKQARGFILRIVAQTTNHLHFILHPTIFMLMRSNKTLCNVVSVIIIIAFISIAQTDLIYATAHRHYRQNIHPNELELGLFSSRV